MNLNPSLMLGMAGAWAAKTRELRPGDESNLELRIYQNNGSGYWFVRAMQAGRWYYKEEADSDHFQRAEMSEIAEAVEAGARVQLVGYHSQSLGVWRNWEEFEAAVGTEGLAEAGVEELDSAGSELLIGCPKCGGKREFPARIDGHTVRCSNCLTTVAFPFGSRAEIALAWLAVSLEKYLEVRREPVDYDHLAGR